VKKFQVGTSSFNRKWESFPPIADVAGFLVLLLALYEGFYSCLLCSENSSLDGDSVMVVLAVSPLAALSLGTAIK
jgi:hypothetical protein